MNKDVKFLAGSTVCFASVLRRVSFPFRLSSFKRGQGVFWSTSTWMHWLKHFNGNTSSYPVPSRLRSRRTCLWPSCKASSLLSHKCFVNKSKRSSSNQTTTLYTVVCYPAEKNGANLAIIFHLRGYEFIPETQTYIIIKINYLKRSSKSRKTVSGAICPRCKSPWTGQWGFLPSNAAKMHSSTKKA